MTRFELPPYDVCSFCDDLSGARECAMILENELAAAQVNERQYEAGAMLVIPRQHRESILDIAPDELAAVYQMAQVVARAAAAALGAVGANIFQNNGIKGGQTEPHFHVHVVPRYVGSNPEAHFSSRALSPISIKAQREIAARIRAAIHRL